ncbi:MAG TPA: hypothetical protein VFD73_21310 [Gemmatimonadales bacterium]|nr:hypothetical protein [Gemmatimonadales bacterium]
MKRPVKSIAVELEPSNISVVLVVSGLVFAMNVIATIVTLMMA